jgi:hypothetical protein
MRLNAKTVQIARMMTALAVLTASLWCGVTGCGNRTGSVSAAPAPTIAEKADAIRNDPSLTPMQKAIAANRLTQSEVGNALSGGSGR